VRDEFIAVPALFDQAQVLTTLDGKPLVVLTTTASQHQSG
jgi:hypothetical protein